MKIRGLSIFQTSPNHRVVSRSPFILMIVFNALKRKVTKFENTVVVFIRERAKLSIRATSPRFFCRGAHAYFSRIVAFQAGKENFFIARI